MDDKRKVVIELQDVRRKFMVARRLYALCAAFLSRYTKASL